jgi:YfiH family protein
VAARVLVTDRHGGVSTGPYAALNLATHVGDEPSRVAENRRRLAARVGVPAVAYMQQVHGRDVAVLDAPPVGEVPAVDALVTGRPGLALAVLVADCVPVVVVGARAVGVAHAGRRGVAAGVVPALLAALRALDPGELRAHVGPAVCGRCYEVPEEMRAQVSAVAPAATATTRTGRPALDLPAAVLGALRAGGVHDITHDATCTAENDAFYSHRRDGLTGRFAAVVVRDR